MYIQQIAKINQPVKSERLEARISPELKARLQKAVELRGSSLSEFVSRSIEEAANEVIRDHQMLTLSSQDSLFFMNAIVNPSKPNRRLKSAYARYKKEVSPQR